MVGNTQWTGCHTHSHVEAVQPPVDLNTRVFGLWVEIVAPRENPTQTQKDSRAELGFNTGIERSCGTIHVYPREQHSPKIKPGTHGGLELTSRLINDRQQSSKAH